MITCALIANRGNRDDDMILYFLVVEDAAGAEQYKLFCTHGDDLLKTGNAGGRAYHRAIEGDRCILIIDLIDRQDTVCRAKLCYFLRTVQGTKFLNDWFGKGGDTDFRKIVYLFCGVGRAE